MNQTSVPERESEHTAIAEFLLILGVTKEERGRNYSKPDVWGGLKNITVEIMDSSKDAKAKQWLELIQTEDDLDSSGVAKTILENDSNDSNDVNATDDVDLDPTMFIGEGQRDHG